MTPWMRRVCKNVFGTTQLVRDEPGGGIGRMEVLPWEASRYFRFGWRLSHSDLPVLGGAAGTVHVEYDEPDER